MNPDFNMGFSNTFSYKGVSLGVVLTARVGGLCVSNTQGILDYYGVSKATADARDAGGVWINNGFVDAKSYFKPSEALPEDWDNTTLIVRRTYAFLS